MMLDMISFAIGEGALFLGRGLLVVLPFLPQSLATQPEQLMIIIGFAGQGLFAKLTSQGESFLLRTVHVGGCPKRALVRDEDVTRGDFLRTGRGDLARLRGAFAFRLGDSRQGDLGRVTRALVSRHDAAQAERGEQDQKTLHSVSTCAHAPPITGSLLSAA